MASLHVRIAVFTMSLVLLMPLLLISRGVCQAQTPSPVVISARMEKGAMVYTVGGKIVEDRKENSLLTNLAQIAKVRGMDVPVVIIVDLRAPFSEVGKLRTALDKVELTRYQRIFVADFRYETMNEIHWDEKPIPIPKY